MGPHHSAKLTLRLRVVGRRRDAVEGRGLGAVGRPDALREAERGVAERTRGLGRGADGSGRVARRGAAQVRRVGVGDGRETPPGARRRSWTRARRAHEMQHQEITGG